MNLTVFDEALEGVRFGQLEARLAFKLEEIRSRICEEQMSVAKNGARG
jgi:hypothetical protein